MFIAAGAAVFDTLRHRVFFHPDNVIAQIPAGVAERKGQHPRNTDHILGLAALNLVVESHSLTVPAFWILGVHMVALIALSGIGVGDVKPDRPLRTQNASDFGEHFRQTRDVFLWRCLSADLPIHTVIAQRVVRRGGDAAMDAFIRQRFEDFETIAGVNMIKLYGNYLLPAKLGRA